jgi:TetR/AcrR family transcriptional regulator
VSHADQILAAATRLFASRGFGGTSLQAIADQVGVTKQTLLYYYPSKEELRNAVLDSLIEHWRSRLPEMLLTVTAGNQSYDALLQELVTFFQSNSDRATLLARELLDNPEGIRKLLMDNFKPWLLLVAQYVKMGQQTGLIREDVDPESAILNVIILVIAYAAGGSTLSAALTADRVSRKDANKRQIAELSRMVRASVFKE